MSDFSQNLEIVIADAMTKLEWSTRTTDIQEMAQVQPALRAVRNQVVGLQILLQASEDFVLALDQTNWVAPLGFQPRVRLALEIEGLSSEAVECFPVGYLEDDDQRWRAEYLDHAAHTWVPADRPQAVYIRITVPQDAPPGSYQGRIRAFSQYGFQDETPCWQGDFELVVSQTQLPDPIDWPFHLDLWQHATSVALHHHVPLWSDAHFEILDRYLQSLAALGQKAVTVIATEMPWSGQRCFRDAYYPSYLYEHAIIDVHRKPDGALTFDFDKLERWLCMAEAHGMGREIEVFGLLNIWTDEDHGFGAIVPDAPDSIRIRCYEESTGKMTYLRAADELTAFIQALADYFQRTGRLERVRITADEPADVAQFTKRLDFVRQAAPEFRYKVAINHYAFMEEAEPEVIDWVPNLNNAFQDPVLTREITAQLYEKGGRMSWYICCGPPIPNTFLRSPLVEGRLIGWLTDRLNLDGFLRWAFCLWPAEPYERISWRAPFWNAGDMHFVLPGPDGKPVETLRYEALRAGIQEYVLIRMLRERGGAKAQPTIDQAFETILRTGSLTDFVGADPDYPEALYSLDPDDYARARQIIIEALEQTKEA